MAIDTKPTPEEIKKHPREFALYCQAIHGKGELNVKVGQSSASSHTQHITNKNLKDIAGSFRCDLARDGV